MASKILIKGYCEDCGVNIPELNHAVEVDESIILQFECPKCKTLWDEHYEFTERIKVWDPPEFEIVKESR